MEHEAGNHEAEPLLRLSPAPSYTLSNNGRHDEDDTDFEPTSELRSRRTTGGGGASEANSIFLSFDNIQYKVDSRSLLVRGFERVQQCLCCNANSPYETINDQSGLPTVDPTINSHANDHSQLPLKTILHGVSGALRGLVAVVGSSGAGKTSLMDILANRKLAGHTTLSGVVEVNGVAREFMRSDFKRMCAYITQDDVLQASLTVHECLSFAARLLLPSSMSRQQKEERVAQVLSMLNLTAVANTQIGGPFQRGISGGEMRRVSIGLEILTQPSILLADEVTSGLDSYSAWSVINVLAKMAHTGATTVVVNIHQPSSALFEMFDSVVLMAKGHIVYQGPVEHVLPYFRQQYNLELPRGWAACDFLLDIVSQKSLSDPRNNHSDLESIPLSSASSSSSSSSSSPFISSSTTAGSESVASHEAKMARMAEDFRNSPQGQAVVQDIATARNAKQVSNRGRQGKFAVDWLTQFWVLLCRHVLLWRRDWISIVAQLVSYLVSGVVIGAMFSNIQQNGQQDEQLTLAISFSLDVFGIMSFLQLGIFIKERSLFNREIAANYYYTSSFFISKSLSTLPIHFVVGLPFSTILYFWIGFANRQFSEYLFFVLTCYMTQLTMAGLHEFVGATFRSMDSALVVAGTFNVLAMTLSGVTSNFPNLPVYLKPFYWLTPLTYSTSALLVTQFNNDDAGKAWLKEMGLQIYDRWESIWILAIFLVAFRFFTYLALRFLHRL